MDFLKKPIYFKKILASPYLLFFVIAFMFVDFSIANTNNCTDHLVMDTSKPWSQYSSEKYELKRQQTKNQTLTQITEELSAFQRGDISLITRTWVQASKFINKSDDDLFQRLQKESNTINDNWNNGVLENLSAANERFIGVISELKEIVTNKRLQNDISNPSTLSQKAIAKFEAVSNKNLNTGINLNPIVALGKYLSTKDKQQRTSHNRFRSQQLNLMSRLIPELNKLADEIDQYYLPLLSSLDFYYEKVPVIFEMIELKKLSSYSTALRLTAYKKYYNLHKSEFSNAQLESLESTIIALEAQVGNIDNYISYKLMTVLGYIRSIHDMVDIIRMTKMQMQQARQAFELINIIVQTHSNMVQLAEFNNMLNKISGSNPSQMDISKNIGDLKSKIFDLLVGFKMLNTKISDETTKETPTDSSPEKLLQELGENTTHLLEILQPTTVKDQ